MSTSILPKGTSFARAAIAKAVSYSQGTPAHAIAEERWGATSIPALLLRSLVTPGSTDDWSALTEYRFAAADFISAVRPRTLIGRMSGLRHVPLNIRVPRVTSGVTVGWVGERGPAPISSMALDAVTLDPLKISGIVVTTTELAKFSSPSVEGVVRADLIAAAAALTDRSFIDPANAGETGVSPASISYGATQIASSGTTAAAAKADLRRLFAAVTTSLESPALLTDRRTALALALFDDIAFQNLGPNGGTVFGVPVLTSASYPTDTDSNSPADYISSITLVDAAEILLGDESAATIDMSTQGTLQCESAPDSPGTAATVLVSLWQRNLVAWRLVRGINWTLRRPAAVAAITNVNYS